jgi:transcription-repair coupling factor (superfamily II helicase)
MLKIEAIIPEEYVPEPQQRMSLYKRLSKAENDEEISRIEDEMFDLYGKIPLQVNRLLQIMKIRLAMKDLRVLKLDYNGKDLTFTFDRDTPVRAADLAIWAQNNRKVRLLPQDKVSYQIGSTDSDGRIDQATSFLERIKIGADSVRPEEAISESHPIMKIQKARILKTK